MREKDDSARGKILDVNGREFAESVRTHSCGVNKRYVQNKNKTVDFLSETLGIPKKRVLEKWNRSSNFFFIAKKIKPDNYIKISQILRTKLGQGLELTPEYERIHPYGESALDLIGASNSKNYGLSGIEQMYNRELSQDISKKRAKRARRGEIIYDRKLKEELSVANVYLTIDAVAQFYTESALKKAVELVGAEHGIAVVQEPKTGKILAAASYPVKDGQSLAFQFTYEPGSTFKTIAISSALDAGVVHITDSIDMSGREWILPTVLICPAGNGWWETKWCGTINTKKIFCLFPKFYSFLLTSAPEKSPWNWAPKTCFITSKDLDSAPKPISILTGSPKAIYRILASGPPWTLPPKGMDTAWP